MLSRHVHYNSPQGFIHALCHALCLPGLYFMHQSYIQSQLEAELYFPCALISEDCHYLMRNQNHMCEIKVSNPADVAPKFSAAFS